MTALIFIIVSWLHAFFLVVPVRSSLHVLVAVAVIPYFQQSNTGMLKQGLCLIQPNLVQFVHPLSHASWRNWVSATEASTTSNVMHYTVLHVATDSEQVSLCWGHFPLRGYPYFQQGSKRGAVWWKPPTNKRGRRRLLLHPCHTYLCAKPELQPFRFNFTSPRRDGSSHSGRLIGRSGRSSLAINLAGFERIPSLPVIYQRKYLPLKLTTYTTIGKTEK